MIHIELRDPNIARLFHHRIVIENIRALKFGNYVDITIIITPREGYERFETWRATYSPPLFSFSTLRDDDIIITVSKHPYFLKKKKKKKVEKLSSNK